MRYHIKITWKNSPYTREKVFSCTDIVVKSSLLRMTANYASSRRQCFHIFLLHLVLGYHEHHISLHRKKLLYVFVYLCVCVWLKDLENSKETMEINRIKMLWLWFFFIRLNLVFTYSLVWLKQTKCQFLWFRSSNMIVPWIYIIIKNIGKVALVFIFLQIYRTNRKHIRIFVYLA